MSDDLKYQKWQKWAKQIAWDAQLLSRRRFVFTAVVDMLNANPDLKRPPIFFEWIGQVFSESALMHVRRQTARSNASISLMGLLDEISSRPEIVTLERYRELYKDAGPSLSEYSDVFMRQVDRWFLDLVGPSGAVNAATVKAEQEELLARTKTLRILIDKRIAHHDQVQVTSDPTWGELNRAVDYVWDLSSKYQRLLNASNPKAAPAGIPSVWTRIFEQPWKS